MTAPGPRFDLLLAVADLEAAAWLCTAIAGVAPALVERAGRRELHLTAADGRVRLVASATARAVAQPLDLAVPAAVLPDLLHAAERAGFSHAAADDPGAHVVTIRPGVSVVVRVLAAPEPAGAPASLVLPPGRLVRRAPRAEAPRAKRPARKNPEAGRVVPESSAKAPRRIVRPRGQVRKGGKK